METTLILYIIAGIISIIIGILLVSFTNISIYVKAKEKKTEDSLYIKDFDDKIYNAVKEVISDEEKAKILNEKFTKIFGSEIKKQIENQTKEIAFKYEKIINEKTKSEEIAWEKYKKVVLEKKQTESIIHSIAEGLVVVDSNGKVIMMNPSAEKLLGISKEKKIGKPLLENLKDEQLISLVKSTPESREKEIELLSSKEETKKIIKASTAVIENEDGKTVGIVSVLSDITKQKELDELKSKFISNITHELRTPLVAMDKAILLLLSSKKDEFNDETKEFLFIIQRNLKRLTNLINDILDFSKFEAKSIKLKKEPVLIEEIIDEVIKTFKSWADTKSINIVKVCQDDLPKVNLDPLRITQVFNNLINNALKFTPQGGTITIEAKSNPEKKLLEVSVKDTGCGIPKEELSKIFDKFYQVSSTSSEISGSGLGLSIVKEIINLSGGNIWAESEGLGKGTKFIFTLPLE